MHINSEAKLKTYLQEKKTHRHPRFFRQIGSIHVNFLEQYPLDCLDTGYGGECGDH